LEEGRTSANVVGRLKTGRTPWLAAGCNKPAKLCMEKTVEVGRNDKDGTCSGRGNPEPRATGSGQTEPMSVEGRSLKNLKRGTCKQAQLRLGE